MVFQFVETVQPELLEMERMMERDFQLRAGHISRFVSIELERWDKYLYPAMLLVMARMFGVKRERAVPPACVVQFIRLATHVHSYDGKAPQYPVLAGDYLYSHFFHYLSKYNCLDMLAPFSAAICQIHEGGIIRKQVLEEGQPSGDDYVLVAEKEWGILLAESCAAAAKLGQVSFEMQEAAKAFGRNLGTAWGIIRSGFIKVSPAAYLQQAREALVLLPDASEQSVLSAAVDALTEKPEKMKKFMAG